MTYRVLWRQLLPSHSRSETESESDNEVDDSFIEQSQDHVLPVSHVLQVEENTLIQVLPWMYRDQFDSCRLPPLAPTSLPQVWRLPSFYAD